MMSKCACGSWAINDDPRRCLCDVCYAYQQGMDVIDAHVEEASLGMAEVVEEILDHAGRNDLLGNSVVGVKRSTLRRWASRLGGKS